MTIFKAGSIFRFVCLIKWSKKVSAERIENPGNNDQPSEIVIPIYEELTVEQRRELFNNTDTHEIMIQSWLNRRMNGQIK